MPQGPAACLVTVTDHVSGAPAELPTGLPLLCTAGRGREGSASGNRVGSCPPGVPGPGAGSAGRGQPGILCLRCGRLAVDSSSLQGLPRVSARPTGLAQVPGWPGMASDDLSGTSRFRCQHYQSLVFSEGGVGGASRKLCEIHGLHAENIHRLTEAQPAPRALRTLVRPFSPPSGLE